MAGFSDCLKKGTKPLLLRSGFTKRASRFPKRASKVSKERIETHAYSRSTRGGGRRRYPDRRRDLPTATGRHSNQPRTERAPQQPRQFFRAAPRPPREWRGPTATEPADRAGCAWHAGVPQLKAPLKAHLASSWRFSDSSRSAACARGARRRPNRGGRNRGTWSAPWA